MYKIIEVPDVYIPGFWCPECGGKIVEGTYFYGEWVQKPYCSKCQFRPSGDHVHDAFRFQHAPWVAHWNEQEGCFIRGWTKYHGNFKSHSDIIGVADESEDEFSDRVFAQSEKW